MLTVNKLDFDTRILNEAKALSTEFDVKIMTSEYNVKPSKDDKFNVRVISPLFFGTPGLLLNLFKMMRAAFDENPDIFHAHDLHGLFCFFPAALIKRKTLIYDSHELWSDISLFGFWKILKLPFALLEYLYMFKVGAIITVNDSIANILKQKYGKPTISIYNYPNLNEKSSQALFRPKKIKTMIYVGFLVHGRGLTQIIEAMDYLDQNIQCIFIGYGPEKNKLKETIEGKGLKSRVTVMDALPVKELTALIETVDVGLCLIENISKSYYYSSPNKLFQYIAAETPVLASNFPEYKKIVSLNKIGELVDPANPKKIAKKIAVMMKSSNQGLYRKNLKGLSRDSFNWSLESPKLLTFYKNILTGLKDD
jgi:glycosyltransferase involved in cell wall biosynthesis